MPAALSHDWNRLSDPAADAAIRHALTALCSPGSFFSAQDRRAIAAHARLARGLTTPVLDLARPVARTAARIATDPNSTRLHDLGTWEHGGSDVLAYLELVAVVAQICAIDSYRVGLGADLDPFPPPLPGDPVPVLDDRATRANAWVPTVGPAVSTTLLSALPDESARKAALEAAWHPADSSGGEHDLGPGPEPTKPQMELVAARTAWLNGCAHCLFDHAWGLRENADTRGQPVSLAAITAWTDDPLIPHGRELCAFVDAIVLLDFDELPSARRTLAETAGSRSVIRAAAVCAGSEGTNRIVGAIGVPVNRHQYDIGNQLNVTIPVDILGRR